MKLHVKYDINLCCKIVLQEQLDKLELKYTITGLGEIEIKESISPSKHDELKGNLTKYGIELMDNPKNILVQKIKDAVTEIVHMKTLPNTNISEYLAEKLNKAYGHLANTFSEVTYTTIQSFVMLQKIERVKQEIIDGNETLTELAWKLNFSSVAHLSSDFKRITGLTPSAFQRIIKKRKENQFSE